MFALRAIRNILRVVLVVLVAYLIVTLLTDFVLAYAATETMAEWVIGAGVLALLIVVGFFMLSSLAVVAAVIGFIIICVLFPVLSPLLLIGAFFSFCFSN